MIGGEASLDETIKATTAEVEPYSAQWSGRRRR
jgi:hypothetical protein